MRGSAPEMSVVIVTPDGYETIRRTVEHLRAQTVKDRLELVIVVHFDGPSVAHRSTGPPGATTAAALPTRPT